MSDFEIIPILPPGFEINPLTIDLRTSTSHVVSAVRAELVKARNTFPDNQHMLAALTEEVGELNQALIEYDRGNADVSIQDVLKEAVQVACMAIRIATEGDASFKYKR